MSSPATSKILKREPLDPSEARWTRSVKITYTDPSSRERTWESAERATRPAGSEGVDGVGIIAVLERSSGPELLLQKQFRPPVGKVCIEVPAGLVDEGEEPRDAAVRELHEETGYVGEVVEGADGFGVSSVMFNDPGFTNTNTIFLHIKVDMTKPENQNPQPKLEDGEFIACFSVPLKDLYTACRRLEAEGYAIDARVGTIAEGIEISKRWKLV